MNLPTRITAVTAVILLLCGCTMQRIEDDTSRALQWLRLEHATELHASGRWQLPRHASIEVLELSPAPHPGWLAAAQAGVDSVFSAPVPASGRPYRLLVAWPAPHRGRGWEMLQLAPFEMQAALVRSADGALVEAARLEVSPRWLGGSSTAPELVRDAFRQLAGTFLPAY